METFFIKPAAGVIVRDPITRTPLASDGENKPRNKYWLSRERDGDVIQTTEPAAARQSKKAPAGGE